MENFTTSRDALYGSLHRSFTGGATWPVAPGDLAALLDLGLSNAQIGAYFGVGPDDVHTLREHYRLNGR